MNLNNDFERTIANGIGLFAKLNSITNIHGVEKLQRKIKQEIKFLEKVTANQSGKKEHLLCTNLHSYEALISSIFKSKECIAVLKIFLLNFQGSGSKRICVDIVRENGKQWVKVVARNPKTLSLVSEGGGEFGQKSIIDQALEYVSCAKQHPVFFKPPEVVFEFACGIESSLAEKLQSVGIIVEGCRLTNNESNEVEDYSNLNQNTVTPSVITTQISFNDQLNLDVSTMIAYVSSLTNGGCNFVFPFEILSQQAEWERTRPVKPVLDTLFEGKSLVCCESAATSFTSILKTIGGPGECQRAAELMARVQIFPDKSSARVQEKLKIVGKVKQRSLFIFESGDAIQAITVTANEGFVRAARNQNVEFAVFIHESRALTEEKEKDAIQMLK